MLNEFFNFFSMTLIYFLATVFHRAISTVDGTLTQWVRMSVFFGMKLKWLVKRGFGYY